MVITLAYSVYFFVAIRVNTLSDLPIGYWVIILLLWGYFAF